MVWLVGNKGMLGQEVARLLESEGIEFTGSDREVDICDTDAVRNFISGKTIKWIVNCSAYTAVDKAEDDADAAFRINGDGVGNLASAAKTIGAKMIHVSTDYVFDGGKTEAYVETDAPNPIGVYGKSKLAGETALQKNLSEFFIVRTAWLYGVRGNNFVFTMLRLFRERDAISVVADQFGTPTFAPDLAAAMVAFIKQNSVKYGVYHFSNEGRISWHDFAVKILEIANAKKIISKDVSIKAITTAEYPTKAVRPANSWLCKKKIKEALSITIRPWEKALDEFMSYVKENNL